MFTTTEFAKLYSVTTGTVRRWIKAGKIHAEKHGTRWIITTTLEISAWEHPMTGEIRYYINNIDTTVDYNPEEKTFHGTLIHPRDVKDLHKLTDTKYWLTTDETLHWRIMDGVRLSIPSYGIYTQETLIKYAWPHINVLRAHMMIELPELN